MKFTVLSRTKAKKFSFSDIKEKTIIISITDMGSNDNIFNRQQNLLDVCRVKFDDVEKGEENCITENDARKILNFVERYKNKVSHIVVHCEAGVSRSAGVCAALMYILNGSDMEIFDNPKFCPNMTCYRTVLNEYFKEIDEKEIKGKEEHNIEVWKKENGLDDEER